MKLIIVAGVEEVVDSRIHLLPNLAVAVAEGFEALENAMDVEAAQDGGEEVVDGRLHLLPNFAVFCIWPTAPSSRASLRRCFGRVGCSTASALPQSSAAPRAAQGVEEVVEEVVP